MELQTDTDEFHIRGREIYWLRRKKMGKSTFFRVPFEKPLGKRFTIRSAKTIKKDRSENIRIETCLEY
ncbi:MAG TPA: hypothetical protein VK249_00920 [Anaerolineales bacterium]|nr:hypothetical protein [Anaerolineales bacterium]